MAFAGIGEIRLRMGDLTGAAAAFAKAEELDASALTVYRSRRRDRTGRVGASLR